MIAEDVALATAMHRRAIAGESVRFEVRCVRKDGLGLTEIYRPISGASRTRSSMRARHRPQTAEDATSGEEQYRSIFNAAATAVLRTPISASAT